MTDNGPLADPSAWPSADRLGEALALLGRTGRVFAVIDGARFPDLQGDLIRAGLIFRPLYLDERDVPGLASGPHLVALPNAAAVGHVRALAAGKPALAFWGWPDEGERTNEAIYRHLRGVGLVEIPTDRYDAAPQPEDHKHHHGHDHGDGHHHGHMHTRPEYETVLFRHADPNVLGVLLPLLDGAQLARLFGKATGIVFDAPDLADPAVPGSGIRYAPRGPDWPPAPRGWLRIRHEQYEALGASRLHLSRQRIGRFLKRHLPPQLEGMPDAEISLVVEQSEAVGRRLGLRSERAHARWAYLMMLSGGKAAETPEAVQFIRQGPDPDQQVRKLIAETAAAIRAGATGWDEA